MVRCTHAHNCAFATLYQNGWCQLGSKCVEEAEAGDSSAMTYAKVRSMQRIDSVDSIDS